MDDHLACHSHQIVLAPAHYHADIVHHSIAIVGEQPLALHIAGGEQLAQLKLLSLSLGDGRRVLPRGRSTEIIYAALRLMLSILLPTLKSKN